jgi:formylglycine-generating enzyme required for sulfatase activity
VATTLIPTTTIDFDIPTTTNPPRDGMVWIPGGIFQMGSDHHYVEERPARRVAVDGFWMDAHPVTNEEFAKFVDATSYVTLAEKPPDASQYPNARIELLEPGSLVFVKPPNPVDLRNCHGWWKYVLGADWRHPRGRNSTIRGREQHPVVHVAYEDAIEYARWAKKSIPTEAEWERAARGGLEGATYAWGEDLSPDGRWMANTWQGDFPWQNLKTDGFEWTSPVGAFAPNGYGLVDMIGNVWEWTSDWYAMPDVVHGGKTCCVPRNPRGGDENRSYDPSQPSVPIPRKVLKGGSHLCSPNYCRRYRPAARFPHPIDTSTCHVGFRCIVRP